MDSGPIGYNVTTPGPSTDYSKFSAFTPGNQYDLGLSGGAGSLGGGGAGSLGLGGTGGLGDLGTTSSSSAAQKVSSYSSSYR